MHAIFIYNMIVQKYGSLWKNLSLIYPDTNHFDTHINLLRPMDDSTDFKTIGGRISIFINDSLQFKPRDDFTLMLHYMECLFVEIK